MMHATTKDQCADVKVCFGDGTLRHEDVGLKKILLALAGAAGISMLVMLACHVLRIPQYSETTVGSLVFYIYLLYWLYKLHRGKQVDLVAFFRNRPLISKTNFLFLSVVPLFICVHDINVWIDHLIRNSNHAMMQKNKVIEGHIIVLCIRLAMIILVAPIAEEILFRGLLLRHLARKHGIRLAIVINSALFAALHLSFGAFVFGVVMCLLYVTGRTLLLPILCHCVSNGLV